MRPSDPCPISSAMRWSSAARFSSAVDISKVLSRSAFPSVAINLLSRILHGLAGHPPAQRRRRSAALSTPGLSPRAPSACRRG
ncbi:hypothetical protein [Cutibacterium acnes]|uniref:hypothetical protein n=1 Tax=Cutibacterium acnes TaxID=1747 RepID=UPI0001EF4007|nr:hypothetical protein HMPREF9575_00483 [Cutibacterium acnes HL110PA1]EFS44232.1 hypothetical protein HMPREF9576_00507 [Cutibacterium acnes HL110PA2]EFT08938.1 hypothetical protein HMPREF9618_00114 [Cutibacterium acnes HL082PA1]